MNPEFDEGKRILVTGGAGFLGSNLCDHLLAKGHEVICLDNFYTGSRRNVAHLSANPNFTVLEHDVTNPIFVQVDEIYNLACEVCGAPPGLHVVPATVAKFGARTVGH